MHERFGSQLELQELEISDPAIYELLLATENAYGVAPKDATIPELFMGEDALLGKAIREEATALIERYLTTGGTEWPPTYTASITRPAPATTPEPMASPANQASSAPGGSRVPALFVAGAALVATVALVLRRRTAAD
ncbi:MAG: hypothetical protein GX605_01275 [Chloroflexi bacterium]|nr:hypothetical protein [Chloroflexota bacterium]